VIGSWLVRPNERKELEYAPKVMPDVTTLPKSNRARILLPTLVCAMALAGPVPLIAQAKSHQHSITVRFNYDFRITPACTAGTKEGCVQEFVVYDVSAGAANRRRLASKSVGAWASGNVTDIVITSPRLAFEIGKHLIAVVARTPDGTESDVSRCTIWLKFK
jgi:hypothetical protein